MILRLPMKKGAEGDRHGATQPGHVADLGLVRGHQDGAGGEEQRDLGEGMHGDVQGAAEDAAAASASSAPSTI